MRKTVVWVDPFTGKKTPVEPPEEMSDEVWVDFCEAAETGDMRTALDIYIEHVEVPPEFLGWYLAYDKSN